MKALVAYFYATDTTAKAAKALANAAQADLYEIRPAVPYTSANLNWMDKRSRPALADTDAPLEEHDVIFLGFPIWWYMAPTIINSFLERHDFSGMTIVLFATSGGSGLGRSAAGLRSNAPGARIVDGRLLNGHLSERYLKSWVETVKLRGVEYAIHEIRKFGSECLPHLHGVHGLRRRAKRPALLDH